MKNKASGGLLKRIMSVLTSMAKSKTLALRTKTNALRTRLIVFSLLRNNKMNLMSSITNKLRALMGQHHEHEDCDNVDIVGDQSNINPGIVVYDNSNISYKYSSLSLPNPTHRTAEAKDDDDDDEEEEEEENKYPDLTHSLFDEEEFFGDPERGSVIELVKNSKEEAGEEFRLEDEIDRAADLFIKRFHRQIRMQKQLSLKRACFL